MIVKRSAHTNPRSARARERLRLRYRPACVRLLFVGESPPASGRFFYQADSGLYRAIRDAFARANSDFQKDSFLNVFRAHGCYLVDLCERPVDRLSKRERARACVKGEVRLSKTLRRLRPDMVIVVVRSIAANVRRSEEHANWSGRHLELPYPGRWRQHRAGFLRALIPVLRKLYPED